jgi:lauroyl/myristoyl acyltransferase
MVMDMHLRGRGVLIASAHAGLIEAAPLALLAAGVRFSLTSPETLLDLPGLSDHLIPVAGRTRTAALRDLMSRLRAGEAVAISADETPASGTRMTRIFDAEVPVSDLCARLSERLDVPTVFPRVLPGEGGVITVDLRPLPAPSADLSGEAFRDAWARAWAAELEDLLRSAPYAMRGTGGFWDAILGA